MAAPSGTIWGSTVGDYGMIGIYVDLDTTNTTVKGELQLWFWSKYSVSDKANTLYFDCGKSITSASTSKGSVSISTTSDSGGWSTTNQKRLASSSFKYDRGTSAVTYKVYAKLTGVDRVGGTMYANTSFTVPALPSYTVKYNANGGTGAPSSQTKYYGKSLTLSSVKPTRSGYTFVGWGSSTTDTTPVNQPGGTYTGNSAYTYYAIWKKTITLKYNANGGSGAPSSRSETIYNANTSYRFKLSTTTPTRTGYTFLGWSKSSSATSATYVPEDYIVLSSSDTLYAVWSENKITINYYTNYADYATYDGEIVSGANANSNVLAYTQAYKYNTSYEYGLADIQNRSYLYLTRTGYKSTGNWGTSTSGGTLVSDSESFKSGQAIAKALGKDISSKNVTINVYAQWEINTYSIFYSSNGGTNEPSPQTKTHGVGIKLSTTVPTRTGYKFLGWSTNALSKVPMYASGDTFNLNQNVILFAIWEQQGIVSVNVNGVWKRGKIWINVDGVWKSGIPYVNVNGTWKQGGV